MGCDTCVHWRSHDGVMRCWALVDLSGEEMPCDVPVRDRNFECVDFERREE